MSCVPSRHSQCCLESGAQHLNVTVHCRDMTRLLGVDLASEALLLLSTWRYGDVGYQAYKLCLAILVRAVMGTAVGVWNSMHAGWTNGAWMDAGMSGGFAVLYARHVILHRTAKSSKDRKSAVE